VGIYTVADGEKWRYFAVNLVNESESDIRVPDYDPKVRGAPRQTGQDPIKEEVPLWIFFLGVAAAALILEWYFWLRSR
jgi:type VI protein secretion system component VasF